MRRACCVVAWFVALLVGVATMPTAWVATHVASEDGYVAFTEPLASDGDFQEAVSAYLADELVRRTGLPSQAQPAVATAVRSAAGRLAGRPGYVEAWSQTQRRSHALMLGDTRDLPAELDATDRFAIDLGPLAGYVAGEIDDALPMRVSAPEQLLVAVNGSPQSGRIKAVKATPSLAVTGAIIIALAAGLTVLLARRRSTALAMLGVGAIGAAGVLNWLSDSAMPDLLDRMSAPSDLARALQENVADRALDSFDGWLLWLVVGGVVMVGLGAAMRVAGRRSA